MRHARLKGHGNGLFRSRVGTYKFFSAVPNTIRDVSIDRTDQVWIGDVTFRTRTGIGLHGAKPTLDGSAIPLRALDWQHGNHLG